MLLTDKVIVRPHHLSKISAFVLGFSLGRMVSKVSSFPDSEQESKVQSSQSRYLLCNWYSTFASSHLLDFDCFLDSVILIIQRVLIFQIREFQFG